jgi:catechol 2,3-dioxygenase-like lactoylglutathione lyase family enzyme
MRNTAFLHANIRCADLEETRAFYERFTGLTAGARPPFASRGYWLYAGDMPVVHLVQRRPDEPSAHGSGAIDHLAFQGTDLDAVRRALADAGMPWREAEVPGDGTVQIFLKDPNGIQIEIAFAPQPGHPT